MENSERKYTHSEELSGLLKVEEMVSESDEEVNETARLGKCEVCGAKDAMYTCPKCEVKTCCLICVNIHKKELDCDGVRDRTKFVRKENFNNEVLLSDYRLLEECSRFVYEKKRDEKRFFTRINNDLPPHLFKLKRAANDRGIALQFLTKNFTRHKNNTTKLDFKTGVISWRVEWCFPNAEPEPLKFVDEKCNEHTKLAILLKKYLNPEAVKLEGVKSLNFYHAAGMKNIRIFMKAEKVKCAGQRYFELDANETLGENLAGKCVIEFPFIFVVLKDHSYNLDVIKSDDELEFKVSSKQQDLDGIPASNKTNHENGLETYKRPAYNGRENKFNRPHKKLLTEKFAEEKQKEIETEIKADKKKKPRNLLFTTGYSSEEDMNSSSDGT